jgi:hypothetical protein
MGICTGSITFSENEGGWNDGSLEKRCAGGKHRRQVTLQVLEYRRALAPFVRNVSSHPRAGLRAWDSRPFDRSSGTLTLSAELLRFTNVQEEHLLMC